MEIDSGNLVNLYSQPQKYTTQVIPATVAANSPKLATPIEKDTVQIAAKSKAAADNKKKGIIAAVAAALTAVTVIIATKGRAAKKLATEAKEEAAKKLEREIANKLEYDNAKAAIQREKDQIAKDWEKLNTDLANEKAAKELDKKTIEELAEKDAIDRSNKVLADIEAKVNEISTMSDTELTAISLKTHNDGYTGDLAAEMLKKRAIYKDFSDDELKAISKKVDAAGDPTLEAEDVSYILKYRAANPKVNVPYSFLAKDEVSAVADYKKGSDQLINQGLRFGKCDLETTELINKLDGVFAKIEPLKADTTVYRGVNIKVDDAFGQKLKKLKVGDTYSEEAFMSTTTRKAVVNDFSNENGFVFEIKLPKGSKALDVEQLRALDGFKNANDIVDEAEMLIPRNSNFRVVSIAPEAGQPTKIALELIDSTPTKINTFKFDDKYTSTDYTLEKLFAFPDQPKLGYIQSVAKTCVQEGRYDDALAVCKLVRKQAEFTDDSCIILDIINPRWGSKSSIINIYDKLGKQDELVKYLEELKELCDKKGWFSQINTNVNVYIDELAKNGINLNEKTIEALDNAGFIYKKN